MKTLGIVGFGAFSQFLAPHLKPYFKILASSRRDISKIAQKLGVEARPIEEAAACDVVIVGAVVQYFEDSIKKIKNFVKPGALILDVSSVKIKPAMIMRKHLPKNVEIVATHPLFGPQSGKDGIKGLKIVLCPIRTQKTQKIKRFLSQKLELEVLERTPEEHDRQMAYVQGLTHFIGRAINKLKIPESDQATEAYKHLFQIKELLVHDSVDLFMTIEKENPYARQVRHKFARILAKLEDEIQK